MIKGIFPTAEECKIKNYVVCTEEGCRKVFKCDSNLSLHLVKTHRKTELMLNNVNKEFHCPEEQCIYHEKKYLKSMKFLRQHYLKVHTKKEHNCDKCRKKFVSEKQYQNHLPYCSIIFSCCTCSVSYSSFETLQTHARRKKHIILSKQEYILPKSTTDNLEALVKKDKTLLPNCVFIVQNMPVNKLNKDQGSQTVDNIKTVKNESLRKISQETQTTSKPIYTSIGTQTNLNKSDADSQKNSITQTDEVRLPRTSSNSNLMIDSSLGSSMNNFEFDNCHMETQTDFIFEDVMLSGDYLMNNTYTQTCDVVLNQFNFNDIQTQTVFHDEVLKSVESQTFLPSRMNNNYGYKDTSHTETQTDMEFRQMLEEINS